MLILRSGSLRSCVLIQLIFSSSLLARTSFFVELLHARLLFAQEQAKQVLLQCMYKPETCIDLRRLPGKTFALYQLLPGGKGVAWCKCFDTHLLSRLAPQRITLSCDSLKNNREILMSA